MGVIKLNKYVNFRHLKRHVYMIILLYVMTQKQVDDIFFQLFCEKNSDGTRHLRLKGRELYERIGRRLNKGDMLNLTQFLLKSPNIVSLSLAYNDLEDEGIKILSNEFFSKKNNLNYINLIHCDIHAEGIKWLSSSNYLRLKGLRLAGNKLKTEGARYIGKLIENCPSLEDLDIAETDQTLESIESLLIIVEKSSLKSLNISRIIPNSYYSRYNNSALADDLGVLLKLNNTLREIRVQKCEFDGHDVELLLGGLQHHKALLMLDLSANRIGDHGADILAKWLRTRPNLTALRIPANELSTPGGLSLGLSLPFSKIRLLDIHNNSIGDQGIADILNSIKKSSQMRMLFIWGNVLGPSSLKKLERIIKSGVISQEYLDVKIYYADGKRQAAFYPTNRFKHKFYSVLDYGFPPKLKIIRSKVAQPDSRPRALLDLAFIGRYPSVNENLELPNT